MLQDDLTERSYATLGQRCDYVEVMTGLEPLDYVSGSFTSPDRLYQEKGEGSVGKTKRGHR